MESLEKIRRGGAQSLIKWVQSLEEKFSVYLLTRKTGRRSLHQNRSTATQGLILEPSQFKFICQGGRQGRPTKHLEMWKCVGRQRPEPCHTEEIRRQEAEQVNGDLLPTRQGKGPRESKVTREGRRGFLSRRVTCDRPCLLKPGAWMLADHWLPGPANTFTPSTWEKRTISD